MLVAASRTYEAKPPAVCLGEEAEAPCCEATGVSAATMEREHRLLSFAVNCFSHADSWPPLGLTTLAVTGAVDSHTRGDAPAQPLQTAGTNLVRDRLISWQPDHVRQDLRDRRGVEWLRTLAPPCFCTAGP